ncbi:(S)-2-hydroxy-acid oxidase [Acrasis kona]|uniref:(S)-2-hydroxy-acid oxidase n=1 Tax=Acrasis kona TaxID=1008807 RepID=A0AAW2YPS2_9EUKA
MENRSDKKDTSSDKRELHQARQGASNLGAPHLPEMLLNIEDYHKVAKTKLTKPAYHYYANGADDQVTLKDNTESFKDIRLRPRVLVDVSNINTKTNLLSGRHTIDFPIMIAPCAMQGMAWPHGNDNRGAERATARAAASMNTLMVVSSFSTTSMQEVIQPVRKDHPNAALWYQLYVVKDRKLTEDMVKKAEKCGYGAIVVTVDASGIGNREPEIREHFKLPQNLSLPNLIVKTKDGETHSDVFSSVIDPSLNWKDVDWLRSVTHLPIIVKGILSSEDAVLAVKHGCAAIIVSNHGARQLDMVQSTIDALPSIVDAVKDCGVDIYVDGGIRRGTDVLKCICMGAKAVLVARPILWGLTVDGEEGVKKVLGLLKKEFEKAMMLCGIQDVKDCNRDYLLRYNKYSKL